MYDAVRVITDATIPLGPSHLGPEHSVKEGYCLYLQKVRQRQRVRGYQAHHGIQQVPRLHEHPEVRLHPG